MASWTASEPGATRWDSSMGGWGSGAVEVEVDMAVVVVVVVVEDKSLRTLDQAPLIVCIHGGPAICQLAGQDPKLIHKDQEQSEIGVSE